ncbi:adenine-specific DNA-methyltransferase [Chryseobacterium arachidis]|uniref:Adenine-specific DNA-methyltransferase n=1 Tax=Chryseobacterium arachidis TaxID=1416778 RepID=A0A1M5BQK9_9FLAO|nr:site-specific DNA-methyltransferase [Chryseobacterium arachidis]SHF44873.1 adenine-specific DNA-methyltransferase [Chryseobacterium arachidis]
MSNYENLQKVLKEIFEMDKADLDFGIYRIMNQKRDQVNEFIDKKLPKEIRDTLAQIQSKDSITLQAELDKMGKGLDDAGVVREDSPKYVALQQQITNAIDTNALEQEVFSHLANFFKRYYKDGDFISLRRYKKDVYAIPYEGEEVKLHWANADQYYIKTSEYLKNYAFKLSDGKKVHFQLKEASTEQNNNKTQGDVERRFAIFEELPVEVIEDELYINFTYETHKKTVKQDELSKQAFEVIQENIPSAFTLAFDKAPTEKNKNRTVLEKHLNDFISRNSFDYFIHKDLGGFLRRELDFYIKNEVLFIDDINTENPIYFTAQLSKIKALKTVASKIIAFLAQIEDFQKKLWLKKKFVISTNYCITLDRIPEKYYEEIFANEVQLAEWKTLYDVTLNGVEVLSQEKFLVLDTKFFSEEFKDKLLAEFDNLDEETDGLLINSENFQALNVIEEKYNQSVQTTYIDPPYNTDASPIMYKNTYRNSSWLSLMNDRISTSKSLLSDAGILCVTIDDFQTNELVILCKSLFSIDNYIGTVAIRNNPSGRPTQTGLAISHEYGHFFSKSSNSKLNKLSRSLEQSKRYKENDENGKFMWELLRKRGTDSERKDSPKAYYPFYFNEVNQSLRLPEMEWDESIKEWNILETFVDGEIELYPIDENGILRRWRWGLETAKANVDKLKVSKSTKDFIVYYRYYEPEGVLAQTNWIESKYSSTEHGTGLLKNYFSSYNPFSYPKSLFAVIDTITLSENNKSDIILDYFAGSGTTGHATIKLNREDGGKRKYILVEMGTYFNTVTKPRIQKVIYSDNWKNGKPQDKVGISQIFKYQILESYEDALNNLQLGKSSQDGLFQFSETAQEDYLLNYMLDVETQDHLFNIEMFRNPFNYQLKVTENNELVPTKIDLVETFNYLIGMYVSRVQRIKDIKLIEGKTREGVKTLIIWRNLETTTHDEVAKVFRKLYDGVRSSEFDQIYINGDHHFDNIRTGGDTFKVKLIEETFFKKMFNISEL